MKKKLIILSVIIAVVLGLTGIDYIIASTYKFHLISVDPERGVADGNTVVTLVLQLKRGDKAISDHNIYIITDRGRVGRKVTDKDGFITVEYRCYNAIDPSSVRDIDITFYDEDNSLFIYVPAKFVFTLPMNAKEDTGSGELVDSIFY